MRVLIRFESAERDEICQPLGPFDWVQLTRDVLRISASAVDNGELELAHYDVGREAWIYQDAAFSDVVIFAEESE